MSHSFILLFIHSVWGRQSYQISFKFSKTFWYVFCFEIAVITCLLTTQEKYPEVAAVFVDCIWVVENELKQTSNGHQTDRLHQLVSGIAQLIPSVVKERLDPELLDSSKIIASKDQFAQKIVRVKTRLFYKQQKFNLLREESEGYSKLVTELLSPANGTTCDISRSVKYLKSLIGCFGLDPNRVVDLILESLVLNVDFADYYIELLRSMTKDKNSLTQILGRKFSTSVSFLFILFYSIS